MMLIEHHLDDIQNISISNSVTLVPRLNYSITLLDEIVQMIRKKRNDLKNSNKFLLDVFDESDNSHLERIQLEQTIVFSLSVVSEIKKRTQSISDIHNILELLPSSIPMIRIISAQLFEIFPNCSHKLSELSVHLGSIVLDSAVLTKARFDFSQSNDESSTLLDKVKLMADSKISKQYPNVDFFKLCNA